MVIKVHPSAVDPRFTMEMKVEATRDPQNTVACPMVRARIERVTLIGPAGRDWREAFTR
jgi:hypothetical protein